MNFPVLIYDDMCTSCTTYAKWVNRLVNGKITMMGHYSETGRKFKKEIFPQGYEGLEMSWFVTENTAYGGSKGLRKLLGYIFSKNKLKNKQNFQENQFDSSKCVLDCTTVQGVMFRSLSILTKSKTIPIEIKENSAQN